MGRKESDARHYKKHKDQIMARAALWNRANSTRKCTARRKAAGLCTRCGKVPPILHKVRCESCNTAHVAGSKERYRRHISAGRCPYCTEHQPLVIGKKACALCLLERQIQELRKAGLPESELIKAEETAKNFNGVCQGCGRKDSCGYWCLDHDHERLVFRGILGQYCNLALGNIQDRIETLAGLKIYLERSTQCL